MIKEKWRRNRKIEMRTRRKKKTRKEKRILTNMHPHIIHIHTSSHTSGYTSTSASDSGYQRVSEDDE